MLKCDRVKSIGKNGAVCGVALAVALSCSPFTSYALAEGTASTSTASSSTSTAATSSSTTSSNASAKSQTVYAKTDASGAQTGVYVVNRFNPVSDGIIKDSGSYQQVFNLTDEQQLSCTGDAVSFQAEEGAQFSYEGDLAATTALPWNITVDYQLDGVPVTGDQLAGASGKLVMTLSIRMNDSVDSVYADNYLVQASGTLSGDTAQNISAPDATVVQSGSDTKLSYIVMPGKDTTCTVEADVSDFSFDGWTIAGVPLSLALDIDDSDLSGATDKMGELESSISSVNEGTSQVKSGADTVQDGISAIAANNDNLVDASGTLSSSISSASDGANTLSSAIDGTLVPGAESLAAGSQQYSDSLGSQAESAQEAGDEATSQVSDATDAYQSAAAAYTQAVYVCGATGGDPSSDTSVSEAASNMQDALTALVTAQATASGYTSAASALSKAQSGYEQINDGAQSLVDTSSSSNIYTLASGADELASGLSLIDEGYATFESGLESYTGAVSTLDSSFGTYTQGTQELADGTQELADATDDLSQQVIDSARDELTSYLNPEFVATDFVNGSTENIGKVQFIIKTAGIDADDDSNTSDDAENTSDADAQTDDSADASFIEKLLALLSGN